MVKFFTAQQLEAIEITAHLKNILNAPLAPSRYKVIHLKNVFFLQTQISMGKPDSGYPGSGFQTYPLSISMSIGSIPKIFGVGLVQHWKEIFFVSEISADPRKRPYGVKGVSHRAKNGQKVLVKFDAKLLKNRNRAKKTRTRV